MKNLLIDIGSSNIKYKLANDSFYRSIPFIAPTINESFFYEVNPIKIYEAIKEIIDDINPDNVFFSTQMHGYVLLKNGKEVSNYVSWQDARGTNKKAKFTINSEYGVNIKKNLPRLSIQDNGIDFDEFCTLGSYIAFKLTGTNASSITDIAPSGFYNIIKRKYDDVSFKLPNVIDDLSIVGKYKNINIYSPIGDHQLSILGATYDMNFEGLILNLGTAGQICEVSKDFISGEFETRPYFFNKYLLTITNIPGGAYIKANDNKDLEDYLYNVYKESIEKLPKSKKILITGGLLNIKRNLIVKVIERIGIDYIINMNVDALHGLEILISKKEI